ncbi:putative moz protein represents a chromatin-associated acetyltransferase protein [Golovinomyces cichoracearum]|uniref:Putative moz protein represents a chromatin-associated acetyltransferase protein n=1 Tax=Golovinomyces cichoracearum TaxID=62708 RepID=A0A420IMR7_9PEZI|nr:putative moz protein represents a chromatin-associated acetyltransferase protein [Golovinomyces cichoracearum]
MSYARLSFFLYPNSKFHSVKIIESAILSLRLQEKKSPQRQSRSFVKGGRRQAGSVRRHGKAVEPFILNAEKPREKVRSDEFRGTKKNKKIKIIANTKSEEEGKKIQVRPHPRLISSEENRVSENLAPGSEKRRESEVKDSSEVTSSRILSTNNTKPLAPLKTVLHMPPVKTLEEQNAQRQIQRPTYVHYFDTYTLVQRAHDGGFTIQQSIIAMKAIRRLLAMNLEVAKASLVGKSDVENEIYLFRAACSELRTEIQNMRRKNEETMRRERTLLQHEVDILNQKLTQELLTLKEEIKGMFDDRKMSVRMEQRAMESQIQELNYKITVLLKSDSKSEVEGLRWVLTRRSVMGILFMAFMVLTSLRYASYKSHENEMKNKREAVVKIEDNIDILPAQGAAEILAAG